MPPTNEVTAADIQNRVRSAVNAALHDWHWWNINDIDEFAQRILNAAAGKEGWLDDDLPPITEGSR